LSVVLRQHRHGTPVKSILFGRGVSTPFGAASTAAAAVGQVAARTTTVAGRICSCAIGVSRAGVCERIGLEVRTREFAVERAQRLAVQAAEHLPTTQERQHHCMPVAWEDIKHFMLNNECGTQILRQLKSKMRKILEWHCVLNE
jgi:hypothetical protein